MEILFSCPAEDKMLSTVKAFWYKLQFSTIQHNTDTHSTCLLKYSGPLLRMRRGTVELKGAAEPAALLSGRAGASVSVGMATRRLGWPAVVETGVGGLTQGGGT